MDGLTYEMTHLLPPQLRDKIVATPDGCWRWTASRNGGGYAQVKYQGRVRRAHVLVFQLLVGPVPGGKELGHHCVNKDCVRPHGDHVNPCTHQASARRYHARAIACRSGHPWTSANTYRRPSTGRRECRTCNREKQRRRERS